MADSEARATAAGESADLVTTALILYIFDNIVGGCVELWARDRVRTDV